MDETDEASVILDLRLERKEICTNGERGLQSLVFHPNFETNLFVYVFYTGWREVRKTHEDLDRRSFWHPEYLKFLWKCFSFEHIPL